MTIGPEALAIAEQYFTKMDTAGNFVGGGLLLYPNPTNCVMQLEFRHQGKLPVDVYATDGRLVKSTELDFSGNRAVLDLMDLTTGMYVVVGRDGKGGKRLFEEKVVRH